VSATEPLALPPVVSDAERADLGLLPGWAFRRVPAKYELLCFCDRRAAFYVVNDESAHAMAFCLKHARDF